MNTSTASRPLTAERSGFITALGWILIVVGGFTTLIAALQNVMFSLMFTEVFPPQVAHADNAPTAPPMMAFMSHYARLFFLLFLVMAAGTLATGVGLVRRMNWARIASIGLMALGIAWNIGGTIAALFMFDVFMPPLEQAPAEFRDNFDLLMKVMMAVNLAVALGFVVLFAWLIKRLRSPDIRREFGVESVPLS